MSNKEVTIEILESIIHWIKVSTFDYDEEGFEYVLEDAKKHYKKYLDEKINMEII